VAVDGAAQPVPLSEVTSDNHEPRATRDSSRVALVTCAEFPELEDDDRLVIDPLRAAGVAAEPAVWDAPADWAAYDLVVLRSTWDYPPRRDQFLAWAHGVPALANPADVVEWNTDKRYLGDLAAAGVPTVPTTFVEPGRAEGWVRHGMQVVLKPAVGAGSVDAGRYRLSDAQERELFDTHLSRLLASGRAAMLQPYLRNIETDGETALLFLAGPDGLAYSHAAGKSPLLEGPAQDIAGLYKEERIGPREATAAQRDVADRVLATVPGGPDRLLYARVDLVPDDDGNPVLLELELTEPSLFLGYAAGAPERFAAAIAARASARR
jgi:glutathione synthase/RimK-type ligase-like ATP-grasp enzyme